LKQIEIELDDELRSIGARRLLLRQHHLARSLKIKLSHRGEVIIVYPKRQPKPDWKAMISNHRHWLGEEIARLNLTPEQECKPKFISLPATGCHYSIHYTMKDDGANRYQRSNNKIHIRHKEANDWKPVIKRWFMAQAKIELIPWLEMVSSRIELPFRKATIRNQQRRWGSCNQHGDFNLNAKLLFLEPDIVEYLFIHELCHTVHMNHSSAYWQLVEHILPNWRELDHQLHKAMAKMPHWI
jgi:predicted metal-dependent hydrolase